MIIFSRINDKRSICSWVWNRTDIIQLLLYGYEISSYGGGGFSCCCCCITIAVPFIPRVFDSYNLHSSTVLGRGLPAVSGRKSVKNDEINAKDPKNNGGMRGSISARLLKSRKKRSEMSAKSCQMKCDIYLPNSVGKNATNSRH